MLPREIILEIQDQYSLHQHQNYLSLQPDLFITVQKNIFPLHRYIFSQSTYIMNQIQDYELVHIITEPINSFMTSKILSLFYGSKVKVNTHNELDLLLDVIDFLEIDLLKEQVEQQIEENFSEYEIFPIMELAYKYNLHKIFKMCMSQLQNQQFEQINYNKFQFIQCGFVLFQIVLRRHHRLKISEQIQGLNYDSIEQVIKLYCTTNKYDETTKNKLIQKYVKSLISYGLLKLNKILNKNMLESAIVENQRQEVNKISKIDESSNKNTVKGNQRGRYRKYSCNTIDVQPGKWSKFKDSVQLFPQTKLQYHKEVGIPQQYEEQKQKQSVCQDSDSRKNHFGDVSQRNLIPSFDLSKERFKISEMLKNSQNISHQHFLDEQFKQKTESLMGKIAEFIDQCQVTSQMEQNAEALNKFNLLKNKNLSIGLFPDLKLASTIEIPKIILYQQEDDILQ